MQMCCKYLVDVDNAAIPIEAIGK